MTARGIFDGAMVLMFGDAADAAEYEQMALPTLNRLLAENFAVNNALRRMRGKQPMQEIPLLTKPEEAVDYEPEFVRNILQFGMAGYLFADDDTKNIATGYKEKYEFERGNVHCVEYGVMDDV